MFFILNALFISYLPENMERDLQLGTQSRSVTKLIELSTAVVVEEYSSVILYVIILKLRVI